MSVQCFTRRKEMKALSGCGVSGGLQKWLTRRVPREYRHPLARASGGTRRHQIREPRPARTPQLQRSLQQSLSQALKSFFQVFDMCPRLMHVAPPPPPPPPGGGPSHVMERTAVRMTCKQRDVAETVCPCGGVPYFFTTANLYRNSLCDMSPIQRFKILKPIVCYFCNYF
jgi:hypothetical protein